MTIRFFAAAILVLAGSPVWLSQETRLPRDLDKLMPRVQEFWKLSLGGQKLKAADFVLPEKREQFVSSTMQASQPRHVSVEFTDDPTRVIVKTRVQMMMVVLGVGMMDVPISEEWVWSKSNWFLDLKPVEDTFKRQATLAPVNSEQLRQELEKAFNLGVESVDLGRILRGDVKTVSIPIQYTGTEKVRIEAKTPNSLVWLDDSTADSITQASKDFRILFDATEFEGAFEFAVPLAIHLSDVTITRSLTIRGNVFAPITFRQTPAVLPSRSLDPFEVVVRNNTTEAVPIKSIMSDGKLSVLAAPDRVEAQSEAVIRFVRRSLDESVPERIWIAFPGPIENRDLYDYRLRWSLP